MKFCGFQWDNGNWQKCGKHGVSIEETEQLFLLENTSVAPDIKHSTLTESRSIAAGRVGERYVFVCFAVREGMIRPISARYMHDREVKNYEEGS